MDNMRTALYIYLPLDATREEIEAAHNIIDGRFATNPQTLVGSKQPAAMGTAEVVTPTPAPEGLDNDGLPWDERIHSSNQKKTAAGGWWAKKGIDAAYKAKIEGELRAALAAGGGAAAAPAATPAPASTLPSLPAATPGGALPPVPGAAQINPEYTALVAMIAQNMQSPANAAGRLTDEWVGQVLAHFEVPDANLQNLAHAPQLVTPVAAYIKQALGL